MTVERSDGFIAAGKPVHRMLLGLAFCLPVIAAVVGLYLLKGSWDDGAITAAFARTLAVSGRMALTPVSPSVEGASSIAWVLLLTVPGFFSAGPDAYLVWMKICSAVCFFVSVGLFYLLSKRLLGDEKLALASTLLLAFCITPFREVVNGMEMNLFMLLTLALTLVLARPEPGTKEIATGIVLVGCIVAVRFESPFLLTFLLGAVWLKPSRRRAVVIVAAAMCVFFAAFELWRYHEFHLWMPNTVYAKRWTPYTPQNGLRGIVRNRVFALTEIALVMSGPLAVTVLGLLWALRRRASSAIANALEDTDRLLIVMTVSGILFSLALGYNWGHPGRMVVAYLPFFILFLVRLADRMASSLDWPRQRITGAMIAAQIAVWTFVGLPLLSKHTPMTGEFEKEGTFADTVRLRLNEPVLHVLIPDVGGSSLCCAKLDINDEALLTNPVTARAGYAAMPAWFSRNQPQMVITQEPWAKFNGLYDNSTFQTYRVIGWRGQTAFVRSDLYDRLKAQGLPEVPVKDTASCQNTAHHRSAVDAAYIERQTLCILLPDVPA